MQNIELKSVVIGNRTKQFAQVIGFGECVGEIRVKYFNGSTCDYPQKDLTVVNADLYLSAGDLLEKLQTLYLAVYGGNSNSLEDCITRSVKGDAFEQSIIETIKKANGAN